MAKRKSIEDRVKAMWKRGDGPTSDGERFMQRILPSDLRHKWQELSNGISRKGPPWRKAFVALDLRFARLADRLAKREKKAAQRALKANLANSIRSTR